MIAIVSVLIKLYQFNIKMSQSEFVAHFKFQSVLHKVLQICPVFLLPFRIQYCIGF
jgi:hypothetical protein